MRGASSAEAQDKTATWVNKCQSFLKRSRAAIEDKDYVPPSAPKLKRKKTFEWLLATNNQLKSAGLEGWVSLSQESDLARRPVDASTWPSWTICPDQGSDSTAAINFLTRYACVNLDPTFCASHAAHNDSKLALKRSGLWPHQLLMVLAWRAWRGPWGSDDRFQEVQETTAANFACLSAATDPLFHSVLPGLLRDSGDEYLAGEPGIDESLWARLKEARCFHTKGAEVSMTRFMGSLTKSMEEDGQWHCRLYGLLSTCLELGILEQSSFKKVTQATETARRKHAAACDPTKAKKETMKAATERELKAIRQASKSAIHLSLMMYADARNQDRQRMIVYLSEPVVKFHQEANTVGREVGGAEAGAQHWLVNMCDGGVVQHGNDIARRLSSQDPDLLERLGFQLTCSMSKEDIQDGGFLELSEADAKACEMALFGLSLLSARLKRNLGFYGSWPLRSCLFLRDDRGDGGASAGAVAEIKEKHSRYLRMQADASPAAKRMAKASMFSTVAGQQYVCMFQASGWLLTDTIRQHAKDKAKRFITSQLCEDGFNRCKRTSGRAGNKDISSDTTFHTLLKTNVADVVHRYFAPDVSAITVPRGMALQDHLYQGLEKRTWDKLREVKGFGDPKWYSPGANNFWEHVVHDEMWAFAERENCKHLLKDMWKNSLLNSQCLVVRRVSRGAAQSAAGHQWFFVLDQASPEGYFGWPAEATPTDSGTICFAPGSETGQLHFLFVLDEKMWEGYFVDWLAPASQAALHGALGGVPIRAYPVRPGPPLPLLELAATRAFFQWPRTTLLHWSSHLKVSVRKEASMFDIVWALLKHILPDTNDEDCVDICRLRTLPTREHNICAKELHESGECDEVLERDDREDLRKIREASVSAEGDLATFRAMYKDRKSAVRAAKPAAKANPASSSSRGVAQRGGRAPKPPRPFRLVGDEVDQKDAKQWLPPGAFLWRAWGTSCWIARLPPHGSHSRSWHEHGHGGALRLVLQCVWEDWLSDEGLGKDACVVKGLF